LVATAMMRLKTRVFYYSLQVNNSVSGWELMLLDIK